MVILAPELELTTRAWLSTCVTPLHGLCYLHTPAGGSIAGVAPVACSVVLFVTPYL